MPDADSTLPSLDAALPELCSGRRLIATLSYHPDLSRVGEYALLDGRRGAWVLGRHSLGFRRFPGAEERCLEQPYISRAALRIQLANGRLHLRRDPSASRCQVAGQELESELTLGEAQLERGVPLLLAHCVVIWLAWGQVPESGEAGADTGLVGSSHYTQSLRRQLREVASTDMDVLLRGATGTGKEVLARAIHAASARVGAPLVTVNMAAIPASLAAAALFGASRGAYTGADKPRQGYFQQAGGGTLFLDEIGDAPVEVQPQLLRALQEREIQPVGGAVQTVDVRVISATDADVDSVHGGFNAALRHRLAALEITLLPLAAHRGDIGELLNHFLEQAFAGVGRSQLLTGPGSSPRTIASWAGFYYACLRCDWPGNIRQLLNCCRQLAVASHTALVVPAPVAAVLAAVPQASAPQRSEAQADTANLRQIAEISDTEFASAMREHHHEVRPVARSLNVSRQAVYRRIAGDARYRLATQVSVDELRWALDICGGDAEAVAQMLEISPSGLRTRLRQEPLLLPEL